MIEMTEPRVGTDVWAAPPFPLTDLQAAYLVGTTRLIELGGFRPNWYVELDMVDFDPVRAAAALRHLVARHEQLRTVMLPEGGQRVLAVDGLPPLPLPVHDLRGLPTEDQRRRLAAVRERLYTTGPDPYRWPLFEIVAHQVRRHRWRVHLAMSLPLLDGHSIRQVMDEWSRLYHDPGTPLPPPPRTYREALAGVLAAQDGAAYREQWRYWQDRLDELPEAPRLPLARRPATLDPVRFTRRSVTLDGGQWRALCAAFRAHRVLPTTALLHVFAETLGAWADSPRFCLNVLHQNWSMSHPETAGVVGQFSATVPLEVDLTGPDDFWQRGQRLQRQLWRDLANGDVTAVRISRELAARRGWTSRAALPYVFTSMVASGGAGAGAGPGRPGCRVVDSGLRTPHVLLDNQVQDAPDGGVVCVWDSVDDAFPPGLPDLMFAAYRTALSTLAGARVPDPVPPRHRRLVAALNPPPADVPPGRLESGFLRQVAAHPEAPAVITSTRVLTYRELALRSAAVAAWLRAAGVRRDEVVPVVMSKGWEQVVAVLGILRAGAAYCPVDAGLPPQRIGELLSDCGARLVLTRSAHASVHNGGSWRWLAVDAAGTSSAVPVANGAGLAYVIYTSGSTGKPKGVMVEHRAALNTIVDINQRTGLHGSDRVFGISSLSFDLSVWDVFGTLHAGAALVLPDATAHPDPVAWAGLAGAHGVTVWNSVPALAEMLTETLEARPELARPPLRAVLLSGDWIPITLPDRARLLWPDLRVIAMGGATEAAIWSNVFEVDRVDPDWRSIPYGRPLRNQSMRVLDHRLDVRPPWATGRIYIGGAGLARGYLGDAARTAERFVTHPGTGERLYWTGDLGRYWPDGTIEFLGREDRQLKMNGFRVEPGEVEAALREHPAVRECVVCVTAGPSGQPGLVAFVVPVDATIDEVTLLTHARSLLPHYMVPGRVHLVPRLPLTANGKVDVARALALALAEPTTSTVDMAVRSAPDDEVLRRLGGLWGDVLGRPAPGPDADFFALGGTSLLALRLVNGIAREFGVDLPLGQIFEAPTLAALATRLRAGGTTAACAVRLRDGDGVPLILFHPVGGAVTAYAPLARQWPGPAVAFQSRGLVTTGPEAVPASLVDMATGYLRELRHRHPTGPYLLCGWSMGGTLAFEVGRQLADEGQPAHVVMLDSEPTGARVPPSAVAAHREFLTDLAHGRLPAGAVAALASAAPDRLESTARDTAVAHGLLPADTTAAAYRRLSRLHADNLAALAAYRPNTSPQPAVLFVAGRVPDRDPARAWRAVCPRLDVEVLPVDHYSIVEPARLASIARRVGGWLAGTTPVH